MRAASPCHMLALAGLALRLLGALAWGPAGGWPGTMDAAHNAALPARMRSYLTNRSVVARPEQNPRPALGGAHS